ncbi:MAG: hypothetical protein P1P90_06295 [Patescibacteria group bacterium]|nr:hypothetical protein [Patescibacteria group bacterium]
MEQNLNKGYIMFCDPQALIETKGLKTEAILCALFNAASKVGLGNKNPGPSMITLEEAEEMLMSRSGFYLEYEHGKRLKLDLTRAEESGINATQYDLYQGKGLARAAIDILRETGDPCHGKIIALQAISRENVERMTKPNPKAGQSEVTSFAEAMELRDRGTADEPDHEYQHYAAQTCTTLHL